MKLRPLFPSQETLGIHTDLYELTMLAAYFEAGFAEERATFELFARRLPARRSFLVAAGLEQALHQVLNLRFPEDVLAWLRTLEVFRGVSPGFFDYLGDFRFSGDLWALPEGTPFFPHEPVLQVRAPVMEAQLLETYLIASISYQTTVATKASLLCHAARGRPVIDFGSRRAQGPQAGLLAARASFIGGCDGTSNVLAGYRLGIPLYGTMAHSFIQFFDDEKRAFEIFQRSFPRHSILLVDTYDTLRGVRNALRLASPAQGVRVDSGDLDRTARAARKLLDQSGHHETRVLVSGDLNPERVKALTEAEAPIDGYGVGTDLVVCPEAPTCDLVYKLVERLHEGRALPRMKISGEKASFPLRKELYRHREGREFVGDLLAAEGEGAPDGNSSLLVKYVAGGEKYADLPGLRQVRDYARTQLDGLPERLWRAEGEAYPVRHSRRLREAERSLRRSHLGNRR